MADPIPATAELDKILFNALLDKSADVIFFKDPEGRFMRVSNRLVGMFSMDHPSQVEGKKASDFFPPERTQEYDLIDAEVMKSGLPRLNVIEKDVWPDDSVTYAEVSRFPIYHEDGKLLGIFGVARDITEQKVAQDQLAATQKELIEHEKKAAVSEFASMIVANLGTSVMEISQAVDRANEAVRAAKNSPDALERIQEELRVMRHMAKRLNDLALIQGG